MTVGTLHFLVYVEKGSIFLWAKLHSHMTTRNSLSMLSKVMQVQGRPKLLVSDSGPAFWNEFISKLREMHINHMASEAYMATRNGRPERSVTLVKHMLQLNPTRSNKDLQDLTQAINSRTSGVPGAGSAYERLLGRKPLLNLPCLPSQLTTHQKETGHKR